MEARQRARAEEMQQRAQAEAESTKAKDAVAKMLDQRVKVRAEAARVVHPACPSWGARWRRLTRCVCAVLQRWQSQAGGSLGRLLSTLHFAFPERVEEALLDDGGGASAAQVRKAYFKAVRLVHPDKLVGRPMEEQQLAQRVFSVLAKANAEGAAK